MRRAEKHAVVWTIEEWAYLARFRVPFVVGDYGSVALPICPVVRGLVVRWRQVKRRW